MTGKPRSSSTRDARAVEREITIDAPAATVWKAITDAEELARWFPLQAKVEPRVGGTMWLSWGDLYEDASRIEVWESERHLRITFPVEDPGALATDYYLVGKGGTTVLRVVTSGFGPGEDWDEHVTGVAHGWDFELLGLKHYLERHRGENRQVAWARVPINTTVEAAWHRLTGPGGWLGEQGLTDLTAGDRLAVEAPGGSLDGTVRLWQPPRQLAATVQNWNDALFRVEIHAAGGGSAVAWLSTYGIATARVTELQAAWRRTLPAAFAG